MKTFRQFIEDIDLDSGAYSPDDADYEITGKQRDVWQQAKRDKKLEGKKTGYKPLDVKFPAEGFKLMWKKSGKDYSVILVDTRDLSKYDTPYGFKFPKDPNRVAVAITMREHKADLITGRIVGMSTDLLSGNKDYRGSGIAAATYRSLVESGQVLFSSDVQTEGGQSNWRKLTQSVGDIADVGIIVEADEAGHILKNYRRLNKDTIEEFRKMAIKIGKSPKDVNDAENLDELPDMTKRDSFLVVGPLKTIFDQAYSEYHTRIVILPHGMIGQHLPFAIRM